MSYPPRVFSAETRAHVIELYRSGFTYDDIIENDKKLTLYDVTKILRDDMDVAERKELGRKHRLRERKRNSIGEINKILTRKWE